MAIKTDAGKSFHAIRRVIGAFISTGMINFRHHAKGEQALVHTAIPASRLSLLQQSDPCEISTKIKTTHHEAMRTILLPIAACCMTTLLHAQDKAAAKDEVGSSFRKPFTLTLQIDKERVYEEKFQRHPYVHHNDVYLFKGDEFGVTAQRAGETVKSVTYQPDLTKADITFKFSQEVKDGEPTMMMLVIKNNTQVTIYMDAMMTIPGKKGVFKTTILPLEPGLSGFESWPHPLVQLVLTKIRTTK